jgi:hypothetical protein
MKLFLSCTKTKVIVEGLARHCNEVRSPARPRLLMPADFAMLKLERRSFQNGPGLR